MAPTAARDGDYDLESAAGSQQTFPHKPYDQGQVKDCWFSSLGLLVLDRLKRRSKLRAGWRGNSEFSITGQFTM